MKLLTTLFWLAKASRPIHWVKNLSLFCAIVFAGKLFEIQLMEKLIIAFLSFNLTTSSSYIFNDILDSKQDKLHPVKKNRPIAAGKLSIGVALLFSAFLGVASIFIAYKLNFIFYVITLSYLALQFLYSVYLKNIPIIDILIIASGFIMRVYAGAFLIDAHLSVWFLLCVISVALFLASGKRRAELNIIEGPLVTRKSLTKYKKELLNSYVTMFGNAAWMSWALFTFFESPSASLPVWLMLAEVSKTTTINKLLMITNPIVIFGIMRYEHLIFQGKSERPEKLLLSDPYLIIAALSWLIIVYYIFYGGIAIF
jgi:4-hydroxybenzoate polyprenyltransferase